MYVYPTREIIDDKNLARLEFITEDITTFKIDR